MFYSTTHIVGLLNWVDNVIRDFSAMGQGQYVTSIRMWMCRVGARREMRHQLCGHWNCKNEKHHSVGNHIIQKKKKKKKPKKHQYLRQRRKKMKAWKMHWERAECWKKIWRKEHRKQMWIEFKEDKFSRIKYIERPSRMMIKMHSLILKLECGPYLKQASVK